MSIPKTLNHYTILEPLGQGGMGEVFVAEDTRLHRRIAIKVLSAAMAGDPERRQRFEREAQAIAALNHPNIVTIYSVEEAEGVPFLTMELVEGRPLSELIPPGGLPLDALLRSATGISDAIGAAHQRGITHRDLKPANVMVLPDGRVKVLDFGLAKLRESALDAGDMTRLPTGDLTGEGRIIGTVAYMSPEQAEGKPVDPRSDIFSLGVMLHEMSTGERPFKGDTNVSVISSILKDNPSSISDTNPRLPAGLAKIIRRSLAKDPSRRYQTATDLRNELEELKHELDSGVTLSMPAVPPSGIHPAAAPRRRLLAGAVAVAAIAALAGGGYWWMTRAPRTPAAGFEAGRFTRLTTTGNAFLAAVSADGKYVVHVKNERGEPGLWVRQTATTSDVQIVPPAPVRFDGLSYSPDGDYVYYVIYSRTGGVASLYKVPVLGGASQRILEDVDSPVSFSPDRRQFAFMRGFPTEGRNYVMIAAADGSGARQLPTLDPPDQLLLNGPAWSPDGRTILAGAQSLRGGPHGSIYAIDVATGTRTEIGGPWIGVSDLVWMPDGRSFVVAAADFASSGQQIWRIDYPSGERHRVTNDLNQYVGVSLSSDGRTLVTVQTETVSGISVLSAAEIAQGGRGVRGKGRQEGQNGLAWTPDGRVVFGSIASGRREIWIMDADGGNLRQLTDDIAPSFNPHASPDGRYLVFQRVRQDGLYVWRMGLDGSDVKQLTTGGTELQPVVGADSQSVYYSSIASGQPLPYKVSIDGGTPVKLSDVYFRPAGVSPDGTRLLGIGWDTAGRRSALAMLPITGGVPTLRPDLPLAGSAWRPGVNAITYVDVRSDGAYLMSVPAGGGAATPLFKLEDNLFAHAWSPDGTRLAVVRGNTTSDVVLIGAR